MSVLENLSMAASMEQQQPMGSVPPAAPNSSQQGVDWGVPLSAWGCPIPGLGNLSFTPEGNLSASPHHLCNRSSDSYSNAQDPTAIIIAIIITALYSMVCVLGLFGNVLVMYVIVSLDKRESTTKSRYIALSGNLTSIPALL